MRYCLLCLLVVSGVSVLCGQEVAPDSTLPTFRPSVWPKADAIRPD